ncbi:hypothetical protein QFZ79_002319 [Arthrobacter sp. V4I6]|nr:hypothetical protein [Arthrobacter sp. V4I6]MDQ0854208.1 hypothetical protein [Arthrobacter sp. V4I6]
MQFNAVVESTAGRWLPGSRRSSTCSPTIPEAFHHPRLGYLGLHLMYRTP